MSGRAHPPSRRAQFSHTAGELQVAGQQFFSLIICPSRIVLRCTANIMLRDIFMHFMLITCEILRTSENIQAYGVESLYSHFGLEQVCGGGGVPGPLLDQLARRKKQIQSCRRQSQPPGVPGVLAPLRALPHPRPHFPDMGVASGQERACGLRRPLRVAAQTPPNCTGPGPTVFRRYCAESPVSAGQPPPLCFDRMAVRCSFVIWICCPDSELDVRRGPVAGHCTCPCALGTRAGPGLAFAGLREQSPS